MTGSGKKGQAYMIRNGSKMQPNNDIYLMTVIKRLERCSLQKKSCEFCENLEYCRRQFDIGIDKYTEHAKRKVLELLRPGKR